MIHQPKRGTRNVNEQFFQGEKARIELLNREFFQEVQLTKEENAVLVWLCGNDWHTVRAVVSAFKKVKG